MYRKLVVVYEGEKVLGEAELHPQDRGVFGEELREIRVSHYSRPSERCTPLAVLLIANSAGICFKLESTTKNHDSPLSNLHATCLRDNKTAIAYIGGREVHLVPMHSKKYEGRTPCFWGFNLASTLYDSCLQMLNLRCLSIVFDLDETLIVANTLRSFEDKIEVLHRKMSYASDPLRVSALMAEAERYQEDKNLLKQYAETDQVIDNGKIIKSQSEVFPALSETYPSIIRPVIRLQDRNIILTRINPLIRDTSVLVRLRPAWEDLRSYLIAKGRKRFEVFVCTMAERDYALEMWRLLDPDSNLINLGELLGRVVCVKSGTRKSLCNVFQVGNCHPKMALVIDDRLIVWDDKDQPRVHVVPAFAPYYAPQAEANSTVPVLCVVRNVACNVRGGFFKEFDECLLHEISKVAYEDDIKDVPCSPDVKNYLISEAAISSSSTSQPVQNIDPRISAVLQSKMPSSFFTTPPLKMQLPALSSPNLQYPIASTQLKPAVAQVRQAETTSLSSPATEEGEVPESELDPDTRRRLLIQQHGHHMKGQHHANEAQVLSQQPMQASLPGSQSSGRFPVEEESGSRQLNRFAQHKEFPLPEDTIPSDKIQIQQQWFPQRKEPSTPLGGVVHESPRLPKREEQSKQNQLLPPMHSLSAGQISLHSETCTGALQEIAFKCGAKVEFKQTLVSSAELQFFAEVLFSGVRIGEGFGRTRREAQRQAAEGSLLYLADKYLSQLGPDANPLRLESSPKEGSMNLSMLPSRQKILDPRIEASEKQLGSIAALKELCTSEGLSISFQAQPPVLANPGQKVEVHVQVEINGQVLGAGAGLTLDEAKSQAAEKAMGAVQSMVAQVPQRHQGSPRSMQVMPNKRMKPDPSRVHRQVPSSGRYQKLGSPVP
ncbi:RNA polymerase II C-terminal domain phosphatase-like 1 isoform X2 [Andrographis paniculata]|uniref:RNA polymerase II C-terminal domain phosphatase-like 1 isoform X2 n=1 Tax=Andrographis paniculata TaxID=175694 RepID=UPI0021E83B2E|nr:RNA polymerase II C-terminal domain phosphatase-like 1 isoform X2 [Andrographis paniculata]